MAKVPLTFACGLYDRMQALYTGEVEPDGIDLTYAAIDEPREIFDRMARGQEFDACEFSSSEFISRRSAGRMGAWTDSRVPAARVTITTRAAVGCTPAPE